MHLLVALGNPGKKYAQTRHNAGWLWIDQFAKFYQASKWEENKKFLSEISQLTINSENFLLAKPTTFMNDSGRAVQALLTYYKIPLTNLLVIHDDKDIDLGKFKIHTNRSSAGHNGVKSIIEHLGTQDFTRLRLGIAPRLTKDEVLKTRDTRIPTIDFVLSKFTTAEKKELSAIYEKSSQELLANLLPN